jgi:hypothetical protein
VPPTAMHAFDTRLAHQTSDPLAAHPNTGSPQFSVNAGRPIGAPRPPMRLEDPIGQIPILNMAGRRWTLEPAVVATPVTGPNEPAEPSPPGTQADTADEYDLPCRLPSQGIMPQVSGCPPNRVNSKSTTSTGRSKPVRTR